MKPAAHFRVDPRLAALLGETYRSTEQALKELVDNAWDADAENVWFTLPEAVSGNSIMISDDGHGMTEQEVRKEYLLVARDRRTRKGDKTISKKRRVKGRKGIGKFAGLMAANLMVLTTRSRGKLTNLTISKKDILRTDIDLEKLNLPVTTSACNKEEHGTHIMLSDLNQSLSYPKPEKLKEILLLEYGRERDFNVFINGELLTIEDLPGETFYKEINLPDIGIIKLKYKIADKKQKLKSPGIAFRVGGKIVGKPTLFGLDQLEDIPKKLSRQVYGEIEADGLVDDVTADWGAFIENAVAHQFVEDWAQKELREQIELKFKREVNLAKARLRREIDRRLATLPEHRRKHAETALERLMLRFFDQSIERIKPVISVVLDAFERDDYWTVLQNISESKHSDIETFANALGNFGLLEMALMAQQANRRLQFLDYLDELIQNENTLEKEVHKALEHNLWVLGAEYSLMSSNKTLARTIELYTGEKFKGNRANKRPDLLLANNVYGFHLLIEFKKPSHVLTRMDESQAVGYRDDLSRKFSGKIDIILLGKERHKDISLHYIDNSITFMSFNEIISKSRTEINWLLKELTS